MTTNTLKNSKPVAPEQADNDLEHFLDLAWRGRHAGASGGEQAARAMAMATLDQGIRLDSSAIAGLIRFIRLAKHDPQTLRDLIQ